MQIDTRVYHPHNMTCMKRDLIRSPMLTQIWCLSIPIWEAPWPTYWCTLPYLQIILQCEQQHNGRTFLNTFSEAWRKSPTPSPYLSFITTCLLHEMPSSFLNTKPITMHVANFEVAILHINPLHIFVSNFWPCLHILPCLSYTCEQSLAPRGHQDWGPSTRTYR